jgi:hypothetical protein
MGDKPQKRSRESAPGAREDGTPVKRRRQVNEDQLKLSKLYEDLAAESDDVRFEAAKQLIVRFSPESKPAAKDVELALIRLIKGLCSQRKAARVGFSLTLTELLREIFGSKEDVIEGLDLDVASLIKLVEEKTKVEGNVPGRVSASVRSWGVTLLTSRRAAETISSENSSATRLFCSLPLSLHRNLPWNAGTSFWTISTDWHATFLGYAKNAAWFSWKQRRACKAEKSTKNAPKK